MSNAIWINAGEVSGDMHGALLVKALRTQNRELDCLGMGGPAMHEQGFTNVFDISELSLMGVGEVLGHLPRIIGLLRRLYVQLKKHRPKAVVLIDAPDFNFFVARMAKRLGIPVFYYICPQVWAWRTGRVKFLREKVDRVLCILPFEKAFLARHGLDAEYVGHPLTSQMPLAELDGIETDPNQLLLLPGSRKKEIETLLPEFMQAAQKVRKTHPDLQVSIIRAPGVDEGFLRSHLPEDIPVEIFEPEDRYERMKKSAAVVAASGTVALETALLGVPTVVAYRMSLLTELVGRLLVKVKHISLPNLILGEEVFPELLQREANAGEIAAKVNNFMDTSHGDETRQKLAELRKMLGEPGAPERAAEYILSHS